MTPEEIIDAAWMGYGEPAVRLLASEGFVIVPNPDPATALSRIIALAIDANGFIDQYGDPKRSMEVSREIADSVLTALDDAGKLIVDKPKDVPSAAA